MSSFSNQYGIDLPAIMGAAENTLRARREREAYERQVDREAQMQKAVQGYNVGVKQPLQNLDPALFQKLEQGRAEMQGREQEKIQKRAQNTAAFQQNAAAALKRNPALAPRIQEAVDRAASAGHIDRFIVPTGAEDVEAVGAQGQLFAEPQGPQEPPLDPIAKRVINELGLQPGSPQFQQAYRIAREDEERQEMAKRRAGATSVNVGTGAAGIESGTKAKFEQEIATTDQLLAEIDLINDDINESLVGFKGQARGAVAGAIDYFGAPAESVARAMGMDPQAQLDFLDRRQELKSRAKNLGDLTLRLRSGANAPESEVKKLEQIVGSIDDMGERQLRSALRTFSNSLRLARKIRASAIAGGTKVADPKSAALPPDAAQRIDQRTDLTPEQKAYLKSRLPGGL